jgi:sirohydrochlorin ferrochelatase
MLPYFLSAGVHVASDLEAQRHQLALEFPHVNFVLCPHLGLHPLMVDIVLSRLQEGRQNNLLLPIQPPRCNADGAPNP